MSWKASIKTACEHPGVQVVVAFALLLLLAATVVQYWTSGFFRQTISVVLLFWPGAEWKWAIGMNTAAVMAVISSLYVVGIGWLFRRRTLATVVIISTGAVIAASLIGNTLNLLTGWKELQVLASMNFTGKANRLIFAQWHNPIWEEVVFRGIPLLCYAWLVRTWPRGTRAVKWCYFLLPSLMFAAYHVPGHGYSRIADTFLLSLVFAWLALRYSFWSVIVLHSLLDAISVLSIGRMKSVPAAEVPWLADHFGALNTLFSLTMLTTVCLLIFLVARQRLRERTSTEEPAVPGARCKSVG
jgi:Type II CAAX prenyl endopeptidase Rce1-like